MADDRKQTINVNGRTFVLSDDVIRIISLSDCEASKIFLKKNFKNQTDLYFERNAEIFPSLLGFYQGRGLHVPPGFCPGEFHEELKFWGIDPKHLSKCCMAKFINFCDDKDVLKILESDQQKKENNRNKLIELINGKMSWRRIKAKGWQILEEPSTSLAAKIYFFVNAAFVLASIFGLVCQTHPTFRRPLHQSEWEEYFGDDFDTYKGHFDGSDTSNSTIPPLPAKVSTKMDFLYYIEYITVAYFTIEIITRIVLYPFEYKHFFIDFLNLVDIVSLLVMYSIYFVNLQNPKEKYERSLFDIIHCMQIIRIFRLFRLVKNFIGFRVLLYAVRASLFEVLLMSMFLIVAMLMFGAFAFFTGDTAFPSIPDSFWWAVVTMTTVGYGDMVPTMGLSKLIGAFCAVTGVCLLAVIIPIFVNNFVLFYNYSKVWKTASESDKSLNNSCNTKNNVTHIKVAPQT